METIKFYSKSSNLLIAQFYLETISFTDIVKEFSNGACSSKIELMKYLDDNGLGMVEVNDPDPNFKCEYEVVVTSSVKYDNFEPLVLKFQSVEFDDEEMEELMKIEIIDGIYNKDEKFRKLVNDSSILDTGFKVIFNYLNRVYGLNFTFLYHNLA